MPGAQVTIINVRQNHTERVLTTDTAGNYTAPYLPVSTYRVSVGANGFKKAVREDIVLNVNDKLTVSFFLEVGDVTQTVTVAETPVHVDLQSATQSTVVNGTQIREQALITRNYEQLVALMPGVSSASVDQLYVGVTVPSGTTATIPFSINGARNSSNAWLVDGADNVDRGSNLTLLNTPSIDAIEEFKVLRSDYSAESGRAGGAQISVVTKSGTSTFHGDLYEFVRNNDFAANNFITTPPPSTWGRTATHRWRRCTITISAGRWVDRSTFLASTTKTRTRHSFFFSQEFRRVITYTSRHGSRYRPRPR